MTRIATSTLIMQRQTKGAVLYSTDGAPGNGQPNSLITSIYLRKDGFPTSNYPATISVTVEAEGEVT